LNNKRNVKENKRNTNCWFFFFGYRKRFVELVEKIYYFNEQFFIDFYSNKELFEISLFVFLEIAGYRVFGCFGMWDWMDHSVGSSRNNFKYTSTPQSPSTRHAFPPIN
jgi:hypothetical protein